MPKLSNHSVISHTHHALFAVSADCCTFGGLERLSNFGVCSNVPSSSTTTSSASSSASSGGGDDKASSWSAAETAVRYPQRSRFRRRPRCHPNRKPRVRADCRAHRSDVHQRLHGTSCLCHDGILAYHRSLYEALFSQVSFICHMSQ